MARARDILKSRLKTMVFDFVCGFVAGIACFSKSSPDPDHSFGDALYGAGIVGLLFALFGRYLWRLLARAYKTDKATRIFTRRSRRDESEGAD